RSQPGDSIVRKLYALLAQGHRQMGASKEALAVCRAGQAVCPDDVELLFLEGQLLGEQGDLAGAEACFLQLLHMRPSAHFASLDAGLRGPKSRHQLALIYGQQGRTKEAEVQWCAALEEEPHFQEARFLLGELYLAQRRWPELEQTAEQLEGHPEWAIEAAV